MFFRDGVISGDETFPPLLPPSVMSSIAIDDDEDDEDDDGPIDDDCDACDAATAAAAAAAI